MDEERIMWKEHTIDSYMNEKISVWWDIKNCPVLEGCDPSVILRNIRSALEKMNCHGPISIFAYGHINEIPPPVQQALRNTGIVIYDIERAEDASNKEDEDVIKEYQVFRRMIVDILFWAIDNPPLATCLRRATCLLISKDPGTFSGLWSVFNRLEHRYNFLLAIPEKVPRGLFGARTSIWLWSTLSAGGPPLTNEEREEISYDPLLLVK